MTYWEIRISNSSPFFVFMPNKKLERVLHDSGINPAAINASSEGIARESIFMQLVDEETGELVQPERQQINDFLIYSWMPVFSERAHAFVLDLGCAEEDFWPCHFGTKLDEPFFLHMPHHSYDVIDFEQSKFLMMIPMLPPESPLPHNIVSAVLRSPISALPGCFRVLIPGHQQTLGEVFVSDDFKDGWLKHGFTGADFRQLTP